MGRSHSLCGLVAGATAAALFDTAPLAVRVALIPVMGGSALLPDIDTAQSRVARSLGPVSWLMSLAVSTFAVYVYHLTRTRADSPRDNNGHRRISHTLPGCLLFGAFVWLAMLIHPIAGAVTLALLVGLLSQGFRSLGFGLTALGMGIAWIAVSRYPEWTWLWPVAVAAGCWVHVCGDVLTNSGVPLLWPLVKGGKRWATIRTPLTFSTGEGFERGPVTLALWVSLAVSLAFATGLAPVLITAWIGA